MSDPVERELAVFSAARRLPAEARAAYLDQSCVGDASLRQRVEELLRASKEAGEFLEDPGHGAQRPGTAPISTTLLLSLMTPGEKAGDRIGHYKLLQQIGEGGCGVVYMAEQTEPVRRRVALKVIKLGMDTKQVIARFEAERQALALMDHPNIAKVLEAGATDAGRPYFVMELVRGVKITEYCDQNNLSTKERLKLFIQVCHAVQHAHQKGIIHRDIKPSNILVASNDGVPVPKVIDFGIAKATQGRLTDQTLFTAFEQFIGTPAYMSPEQAELTMLDVDTRTDIYSLGVLLYELLIGRTPFDAKDLLAAGLDAMRRTIREQEPDRPSTRLSTMTADALTTTAHHRHTEAPRLLYLIRGDLDCIVMKAMEKDRARRYETANSFATDIERHLNNEPVVARPPSNLYRFQKLVGRNKLAFAAASAVVGALMSGLAVATFGLIQARTQRNEARASEKMAQSQAAKSQQVARLLKDMLRGVGPSRAIGRDTTMLREILDKTAERVGINLTNQPEVAAELFVTLSYTYHELGLYAQMETMARRSLQLARKKPGEESEMIARSLSSLGDALHHLDNLKEAEKYCVEGLEMWKKVSGGAHIELASSFHDLGLLLDRQGRLVEAEKMHRQALDMRMALLGSTNGDTVSSLEALAGILQKQNKLGEAESMVRSALAMRRNLFGYVHPTVAHSLNDLTVVLYREAKLTEAEILAGEALAIRKKIYDKEHDLVVHSLQILSQVLTARGELDKAESARREELAIQAKLLGLEAPAFTTTLYNLAILLSRQGKLAEAQRCFREAAEHGNIRAMKELALRLATGPDAELRDGVSAVTFAERAAGATNWNDPGILAILAAAYAEAGQFANAVDFQQKAMALAQNDQERNSYASRLQLYQSNSPYRDDRLLAGKVSALLARGNFAEAEPFARECLAHREKELPDDWLTFDTRALLGESLLGQKKYPEAERMLLSGYEGMKQREQTIPVEGKFRLDAALRRLVLLYEAAAREDQAAIWKQREALARAGAETEAETETRASGVTYARLGRFSQAAAAFARVVELHPDDYYARHSEAAALIQCRQIEDYHVLRHQGVQRFMNTTNHHAADQIAKDFLVLPASGPDLETAAKMAETAVSAPANHPDVTWFRLVKCLAEYRQGHFASAVEWAQKVLINSGHFSERDAGAYLVLAMAQHQLKQSEAAHAALAKGLEIVDKKMAELNSGDLGGSWVDWIIAQALLDEARALIDGKVAIPQGVN